ncbi:MAG: hypothetical protein V1663_03235 [archaeon]
MVCFYAILRTEKSGLFKLVFRSQDNFDRGELAVEKVAESENLIDDMCTLTGLGFNSSSSINGQIEYSIDTSRLYEVARTLNLEINFDTRYQILQDY